MILTDRAEFTTAITNIVNAGITLIPMILLLKKASERTELKSKCLIWFTSFGFFFAVSLLGFIVHGFVWTDKEADILWRILNILISFMLGSYVVAILFETHGPLYLKRYLMINSILAVAFSALRIFLDEKFSMGFMVFIIYCLLNIIFVSAQLYRSRKENPHFIWLAAGIVFLVTGSALQTIKSIHFTIIWEFNYNCVYHIFTLIFVILQFIGVMRSIRAKEALLNGGNV